MTKPKKKAPHHSSIHNHGHGMFGVGIGIASMTTTTNGTPITSSSPPHSTVFTTTMAIDDEDRLMNMMLNDHFIQRNGGGIISGVDSNGNHITHNGMINHSALFSQLSSLSNQQLHQQLNQLQQMTGASNGTHTHHHHHHHHHHHYQQQQQQQQNHHQQSHRNGFIESKMRNRISMALSRTVPPLVLIKEAQLKLMVSKLDRLSLLSEKLEVAQATWQTMLESKNSAIEDYIRSITCVVLQTRLELIAGNQLQQVQSAGLLPTESSSKAYKNKGNELFQKKQYFDALLVYSEALRLYDKEQTKDPQTLSSIYSNRCICLVHLEKFEEGAAEASRGLECGSSDHLVHKLLYRRGICYFSMKKHAKAKADFLEAHKLVSKMDGSDIQSIESYLEKINKMKQYSKDDGSEELNPMGDHNSLVDKRIQFKYAADNLGRVGEATESIPSNTILFQEKAYVTALDRSSYSSHCHNCFKEIFAPIYCKKCHHAQYCSKDCLTQDFNNYHDKECGRGFLLLCSSESLLVLRLLMKKNKEAAENQMINEKTDSHYIPEPKGIFTPPNEIEQPTSKPSPPTNQPSIASPKQPTKETLLVNNLQFEELGPNDMEPMVQKANIYTPNYNLIHSFDPHFNEHSNAKLTQLLFDAFMLERFLQIYQKYIGVAKEDININTILRHLCQLSTYIYSIPVFIAQDDPYQNGIQRFIPVKIAYAIFPMSSLLNHSCDNNTILQYNGTSIVVKSLKDIDKNDEITACYGPHSFHMELRDRLSSLKEEYFFTCRCHACNAKYGPNTIKCPKESCGGSLLERVDVQKLMLESNNNNDDEEEPASFEDYSGRSFTCNTCNLELSVMDTFLLTSKCVMSTTFFDNASKILSDGEPNSEVENLLFRCLELRRKVYHENSRKLGEVYDQLARLYIARDNYKEAVNYAEKAVSNMYVRLGHNHSTELAREWGKLANIYINAGEPTKAIKAINTAESLLVKWKTEPSDEEILSQLRNHKKVLEASKVIPNTNKVEINLSQLCSQSDFDSDSFLQRMILYHNKDKN